MPVAQHTNPDSLARDINKPAFCYHLWCFLEDQLDCKLDATSSPFIYIPDKIHIYSSAVTTYCTMHPAICVGQVACSVSVYTLLLPGGMEIPNMTVF